MKLTRRYAAWCRRQASTMNCGGGPLAVLACAAVFAVCGWLLATRYWTVICEAFWLTAGALTAVAVTWALLAAGEARHRRWLRSRCESCRTAAAIAAVRFANALRSDTARLCGPCWKTAEHACTAAAGAGSTWEMTRPAHGLPVVSEEPPVTLVTVAPEPADYARQPVPAPAAWDNEPASEPLPPELAAHEQAIVPPSHWTRGHP